MTTIAIRNGVIAADTGITIDGSIVIDGRVKIARRDDGALIAAAGASGFCDTFRAWALAGDDEPAPKITKNSGGIIVTPDNAIHIYDCDEGLFVVRPPYFAYGSGAPFALGAMHAGATAEAAVRAAIAHDSRSNGDVLVLHANPEPHPVVGRQKVYALASVSKKTGAFQPKA